MPTSYAINSPYKTTEEAAAYIRKGLSTFRGYVRRYKIPRHGPAGDRFRTEDLDAFMADCNCFLHPVRRKVREKTSFTPVSI